MSRRSFAVIPAVALSIAFALSGCTSSEQRAEELTQALIDGGYAKSFTPMDEVFLKDLKWASQGVSDNCMSIIEVTDYEMLRRAAETGLLPADRVEVWVAKDSDDNTAVNGNFILAKARQDGEYCGTLMGDHGEDELPGADDFQDEVVRFFREIK